MVLLSCQARVLCDYKNYCTPKTGINNENVDELQNKVSSFTEVQRYILLIMDEMKIQSGLVFDKHSGNLIGFIDLGDPMTNFACLQDEDTIATHALHFLLKDCVPTLNTSLHTSLQEMSRHSS